MREESGVEDGVAGRVVEVEGRGGMEGGRTGVGEEERLGVPLRMRDRWLRISGSGTDSIMGVN